MKAQGLSMNVLVVAAIAVMVLLVLGLLFSGGFRSMGSNLSNFISGTSDSTSVDISVCNNFCTQYDLSGGNVLPPTGYCHSDISNDCAGGSCTAAEVSAGTCLDCNSYCDV